MAKERECLVVAPVLVLSTAYTWTLTRTNEGERCRSWALHLPWPRAFLASNLLVGLIKPLM
jgi:hypothetical protein